MLVGSIYMFAGSVAPEGFIVCDGSAVSRSTYSELFDTIGTTYGPGDGSTTFNIPDLSGKVIVGVSTLHSLASTGGEETHALIESEIPSHSHSVPQHGHTSSVVAKTPEMSHTITQPAFNYNRPNGTAAGGAAGGTLAYSGTSSVAASRTKNVAVSAHAAAACTKEGAVTDCAAFDSEEAGEGTGHDNMQPYMTMNYIIYTGA